jgi:catechol 2,3-dioxygenase-like lactoylglutathione lyase family enzyme
MKLGNFSVSLAVKDLQTSRAFYEDLGFEVIAGEASQNWLILQSGTSTTDCSRACSSRTS